MKTWYMTTKGRIVPASTRLGKDEYPKWMANEGDKEWKKLKIRIPQVSDKKN